MKILDNYPVENAAQIKKASSYFDEHILKFKPYDRVKISKSMHEVCTLKKVPMDKSASYNAYFNSWFNKEAMCDINYLKPHIEERKVVIGEMEIDSNGLYLKLLNFLMILICKLVSLLHGMIRLEIHFYLYHLIEME